MRFLYSFTLAQPVVYVSCFGYFAQQGKNADILWYRILTLPFDSSQLFFHLRATNCNVYIVISKSDKPVVEDAVDDEDDDDEDDDDDDKDEDEAEGKRQLIWFFICLFQIYKKLALKMQQSLIQCAIYLCQWIFCLSFS